VFHLEVLGFPGKVTLRVTHDLGPELRWRPWLKKIRAEGVVLKIRLSQVRRPKGTSRWCPKRMTLQLLMELNFLKWLELLGPWCVQRRSRHIFFFFSAAALRTDSLSGTAAKSGVAEVVGVAGPAEVAGPAGPAEG